MPTPNLIGSANFPARLKSVITELSVSIGSLADTSGVPLSILHKYLADEATPNLGMVESLAAALDLNPGWLAFGIGPKQAPSAEELAAPYAGDAGLTGAQLDDRYNQDGDGEHPLFHRAVWIQATSEYETLLGYWDWVSYRLNSVFAKQTQVG